MMTRDVELEEGWYRDAYYSDASTMNLSEDGGVDGGP